jgi:hypothetical protein
MMIPNIIIIQLYQQKQNWDALPLSGHAPPARP